MELRKFQKLDIDLPQEPIINECPWLIAGVFFAFAFLLSAAYAFLLYKGII